MTLSKLGRLREAAVYAGFALKLLNFARDALWEGIDEGLLDEVLRGRQAVKVSTDSVKDVVKLVYHICKYHLSEGKLYKFKSDVVWMVKSDPTNRAARTMMNDLKALGAGAGVVDRVLEQGGDEMVKYLRVARDKNVIGQFYYKIVGGGGRGGGRQLDPEAEEGNEPPRDLCDDAEAIAALSQAMFCVGDDRVWDVVKLAPVVSDEEMMAAACNFIRGLINATVQTPEEKVKLHLEKFEGWVMDEFGVADITKVADVLAMKRKAPEVEGSRGETVREAGERKRAQHEHQERLDAATSDTVCNVLNKLFALFRGGEAIEDEARFNDISRCVGVCLNSVAEQAWKGLLKSALDRGGGAPSDSRADVVIKCAVTTGAFLSDSQKGVWCLTSAWCGGSGLKELLELMRSDSSALQMHAGSEVVVSACNVDEGRVLFKDWIEGGGLDVVMSKCKANGAAIFVKLGMASKAMGGEEAEELLDIAEGMLDGEGRARAVEILSYLCSKTKNKEVVCHGQILKLLVKFAKNAKNGDVEGGTIE